jgi:hypothetical protein
MKQLEARRLQFNALEQPRSVSTDKHREFYELKYVCVSAFAPRVKIPMRELEKLTGT